MRPPAPPFNLYRIGADRWVVWGLRGTISFTGGTVRDMYGVALPAGPVKIGSEPLIVTGATGFVGDGAQVRAVVKRLRRKLAEAQAPVMVETVRGSGFRLAARPTPCGTWSSTPRTWVRWTRASPRRSPARWSWSV